MSLYHKCNSGNITSTYSSEFDFPAKVIRMLHKYGIHTLEELKLCNWEYIQSLKYLGKDNKSILLSFASEHSFQFVPYGIDGIDSRMDLKRFLETPIIQLQLPNDTIEFCAYNNNFTVYDLIFDMPDDLERMLPVEMRGVQRVKQLYTNILKQIFTDDTVLDSNCNEWLPISVCEKIKLQNIYHISELLDNNLQYLIAVCELSDDDVKQIRIFLFKHGLSFKYPLTSLQEDVDLYIPLYHYIDCDAYSFMLLNQDNIKTSSDLLKYHSNYFKTYPDLYKKLMKHRLNYNLPDYTTEDILQSNDKSILELPLCRFGFNYRFHQFFKINHLISIGDLMNISKKLMKNMQSFIGKTASMDEIEDFFTLISEYL